MSLPAIPARPSRSQNIDIPAIPARPKRSVDRSVSPNRDSFARSPFNDPDTFRVSKSPGHSGLSRSVTREELERVPSVSMPLVGEEGNEYDVVGADKGIPTIMTAPDSDVASHASAEQTKTIDSDLPLHAPKASLPVLAAKSRIQTVTRTDSNSAAALGIGKPREPTSSEADSGELPETEEKLHQHAIHLEHTSRPGSSAPRSRPSSIFKPEEDEQGIPHIGLAVPLLAHVGDVQAPTPKEDGVASSGSSGIGILHKASSNQQKHHFRTKSGREVYERPPDSYGLHGHGINKEDAFEKAWYEKHPEAKALEEKGEFGPRNPIERKDYHLSNAQLNKLVQDEANETHHSGTPDENVGYLATEEYTSRLSPRPPSLKRGSSQYAESPLRKVQSTELKKSEAVEDLEDDKEDEEDEEDVFHVVATPIPDQGMMPARPTSEFGDADEAPILAADEVARRPHAQSREAAVGGFGEDEYTSREQSRVHSRANSIHHESAPHVSKEDDDSAHSHQYEPLFAEDDKTTKPPIKKEADDDEQGPRHFFPSKDVWEDTPDSLKYETSVDTPQVPEFSVPHAEHEPREIFEKPDTVPKAQRQESAEEAAKLRKTNFSGDVLAEVQRPRQHRFPSRDVWEDTPDSHLYTTTIVDDSKKPEIPGRPASDGSKKVPSVPGRPKPQVPTRPAVKDVDVSSKSKPPVPARPVGSKIAAIRGAFMTDLESKLQSGPQALSKTPSAEEEIEEPVVEKAPLADARKGRAKGPARRKPGASSASSSTTPKPKVSFLSAVTIWSIDEDGTVEVTKKKPLEEVTPAKKSALMKDEQTQTGTMELEIPNSADHEGTEKATVYIDGKAPERGTIVVTEDGVEHVGGVEGMERIEKVGGQIEAVKAS